MKKFLYGVKHLWKQYLVASLILMLSSALRVIYPLLTQQVIDQGIVGKSIKFLILFLSIQIGVCVMQILFTYIGNLMYADICRKYKLEVKEKILYRMGLFQGKDIANVDAGNIMDVIENDVESVAVVFTDKINEIIMSAFMAAFSFLFLLFKSPKILILSLGLQLVLYLVNYKLAKRIERLNQSYFVKKDEQSTNLQEYITNLEYLIQASVFPYFAQRFMKGEKEESDLMYQIERTTLSDFSVHSIISAVSTYLIWLVCGMEVLSEGMSLGSLYAIDSYAAGFFSPMSQIIEDIIDLKRMKLEIIRVNSLLDCTEEGKISHETVAGRKEEVYAFPEECDITFKNIVFAYQERKILNHIHLRIQHHTVNVIMGKSGQGKSTITKLLSRLWEYQEGCICFGEHEIKEYSVDQIRRELGIVTQNIAIFNGSIYENIVLDYPVSEEKVYEICKKVGIYDEIMEMEEGFGTIVKEYGRNLSGGQKQRIAIARAFLKDASIFIFDEPTSNLDKESKNTIKQLIYHLKKKTVILITHDEEMIDKTANVFHLNDGSLRCVRRNEKM